MTTKRILPLVLGFLGLYQQLSAFEVDSKSDGSMGALNITEDTVLTAPEDGIFKYSSVTIAEGATVRFIAGSAIRFLVVGDVVINGTIDLDGQAGGGTAGGAGGPGGWAGGSASGTVPKKGLGPGGGYAASLSFNDFTATSGSYATQAVNNSGYPPVYGSPLLIPLVGGSGGGGGAVVFTTTDSSSSSGRRSGGGGGGGGAILIVSESQILIGETGRISARGGNSGARIASNVEQVYRTNGGSGGAVRLLAPSVEIKGGIDALGGDQAGSGFVRVDSGLVTNSSSSSITGTVTYGKNRVFLPENTPTLQVTHIGGQAIDANGSDEIYVNLPPNGQTLQEVRVSASGFAGPVEAQVFVIPDNATQESQVSKVDITIPSSGEGTASASVNVEFQPGRLSQVFVFTKNSRR